MGNLGSITQKEGVKMILRLLVIPFCAALFFGVHTVVAHTDMQHGDTALTVTVGDVTSGSADLEDFVKHAAAHLSEAGSFAETLGLLTCISHKAV